MSHLTGFNGETRAAADFSSIPAYRYYLNNEVGAVLWPVDTDPTARLSCVDATGGKIVRNAGRGLSGAPEVVYWTGSASMLRSLLLTSLNSFHCAAVFWFPFLRNTAWTSEPASVAMFAAISLLILRMFTYFYR